MFTKDKLAALVAEFLGTALLVLVILSVTNSNIGIPYFISIAAGLTLVVATLVFGAISGAILNPAITLGLWSVRKLQTVQALSYIIVQIGAGAAAYLLYSALSGQDLSAAVKYKPEILVAEILGTAIFAFGIAAAAYNQLLGSAKAFAIGGAFTLGLIVASIASPSFLNPAIALGSQSLQVTNFVVGPVLGALLGFNLYSLLHSASQPVVAVKSAATKKSVTKKPKK